MADCDRYTAAKALLRDAWRSYEQIEPGARSRYPELQAAIAIGLFMELLVDSEVKFGEGGNVERRPHIKQTYPSR